jgi:Zn-dependent peptidase ImmA (M78 family)
VGQHLYPTQFRLIEEEVENTLLAYGDKYDRVASPPVPVEMVAERLLDLRCEIAKLGRYGQEVLGVLLADQKRLLIDERCTETQYYFTVAHEIGHWLLHIPLNPDKAFIDTSNTITTLLRSTGEKSRSKKTTRAEIEANQFAAALLLPRSLLMTTISQYTVINADAVTQLAISFQTAITTTLYRLLHLVKYINFLERDEQQIIAHVDRASLYVLKDNLHKRIGN